MIVSSEKITDAVEGLVRCIEEDGENGMAVVEEVMVIAAVSFGDADEESETTTYFRCSSSRPWVQSGLLREAEQAAYRSRRAR